MSVHTERLLEIEEQLRAALAEIETLKTALAVRAGNPATADLVMNDWDISEVGVIDAASVHATDSVRADSEFSHNGTAGVTGTANPDDTLTVKGGIITTISPPLG